MGDTSTALHKVTELRIQTPESEFLGNIFMLSEESGQLHKYNSSIDVNLKQCEMLFIMRASGFAGSTAVHMI